MLNERLITLREVPNILPKRRGKRTHICSVYRWVSRGVRGRKLEVLACGGVFYTSHEALDRFLRRRATNATPPPAATGTSKAIERAERELREAGI